MLRKANQPDDKPKKIVVQRKQPAQHKKLQTAEGWRRAMEKIRQEKRGHAGKTR